MHESETFEWSKIREAAIQAWGSVPHGLLEAEVIAVFEKHPALVQATVEKTTSAYQSGRINNPWAILRLDLQKLSSPERNPTVTDERPREKAVARAEQWVRTTGIHYPTEAELLGHLFGTTEYTPTLEQLEQHERETRNNPGRYLYDSLLKAAIFRTRAEGQQLVPATPGDGLLEEHRTPEIQERMLRLWRELRPIGEQLEQDATDRGTAYQANLKAQKLAAKAERDRLDQIQAEAKLEDAERTPQPVA